MDRVFFFIIETILFILVINLGHLKLFIAGIFLFLVHLAIHSLLHFLELTSAIPSLITGPVLFYEMLVEVVLGPLPFILNSFSFTEGQPTLSTFRHIFLLLGDFWVSGCVESTLGSEGSRFIRAEIELLDLIFRPVIFYPLMRWSWREPRFDLLVFGVERDLSDGGVSMPRVMALSPSYAFPLLKISTLRNIEASGTGGSLERCFILLNGIPDDVWLYSWKSPLFSTIKNRYLRLLLHRLGDQVVIAHVLKIIRRCNRWELNRWSLLERGIQVLRYRELTLIFNIVIFLGSWIHVLVVTTDILIRAPLRLIWRLYALNILLILDASLRNREIVLLIRSFIRRKLVLLPPLEIVLRLKPLFGHLLLLLLESMLHLGLFGDSLSLTIRGIHKRRALHIVANIHLVFFHVEQFFFVFRAWSVQI